MRRIIIGLVGPSGAEKTTVARVIEQEYGFTRIHVAQPIMDAFCAAISVDLEWLDRHIGRAGALPRRRPAARCAAVGRFLSPIVWSEALLKIVPYDDHPVTNAFTLVSSGGAPTQAGGDTISLTFTDPAFKQVAEKVALAVFVDQSIGLDTSVTD